MSSVEDKKLGIVPVTEPIGDEERKLLAHFVVEFAREISTDGGKTAKIEGAMIVLDQPTAQPKRPRRP